MESLRGRMSINLHILAMEKFAIQCGKYCSKHKVELKWFKFNVLTSLGPNDTIPNFMSITASYIWIIFQHHKNENKKNKGMRFFCWNKIWQHSTYGFICVFSFNQLNTSKLISYYHGTFFYLIENNELQLNDEYSFYIDWWQ